MDFLFLSPHPDDVALSCGGLICELAAKGYKVEACTIFSGDPPEGSISPIAEELHLRWQTGRDAPSIRRQEDRASMQVLGIKVTQLDFPDVVYRRWPDSNAPVIQEMKDLFAPIDFTAEQQLIVELADAISPMLTVDTMLVSPFGLGQHIDHMITRAAARSLTGSQTWYYADYPYVLHDDQDLTKPSQVIELPISKRSLSRWQRSVAKHKTQISTFWGSVQEMSAAIADYHSRGGGAQIWQMNP